MKQPSLWQITIQTSPEAEEAVAQLLERLFHSPPSTYATEQTTRVTVFSPKPAANRKALQQGLDFIADCGLDTAPATISVKKVPPQDWSESWKKHFAPLEIGPSLLIKPSWSKKRPRKNQATVVLDPGLSFGTGQHPTTHFCLEQMVRFRNPAVSQSLLDAGTGSGIIAIAAAKIGYQPVHAFDNDPVAVRVAQANARRNRVSHKVEISSQDLTSLPVNSREKYNVLCANLIDELLITHAKLFLNRLQPGGLLVIAGVLAKQFPAVQKTFENLGLKLTGARQENEWKSAAFLHKKA